MAKNVNVSDLSGRNDKKIISESAIVFKGGHTMLYKRTGIPPQYGFLSAISLVLCLTFLKENVLLLIEMHEILFNPYLMIVPQNWVAYCDAGAYSSEWIFLLTWAFLYSLPWQKNDLHPVMLGLNLAAIVLFALFFGIACAIVFSADALGLSLWGNWRKILLEQTVLLWFFFFLVAEYKREYLKAGNS